MISATAALARLKEGNRRFVAGDVTARPACTQTARDKLVDSQAPFAIILGCSDSRVPAELVFDQGLGDLFVIRVAGNIVAPSQIGSVEFAAEQFGTRLVVVMGHTQCGAVQATLEQLRRPDDSQSPNLRAIVELIRPAVEPIVKTSPSMDIDALRDAAVKANIRASSEQLRHGSAILEELIREQGLIIASAEYSLANGVVTFLDDN